VHMPTVGDEIWPAPCRRATTDAPFIGQHAAVSRFLQINVKPLLTAGSIIT
jgi:hypothetical protein